MMKIRPKYPINRIALYMAGTSFLIGTLILIAYSLLKSNMIAIVGFYYIQLAALTNVLLLALLIVHALYHYQDYKEHLLTLLILLVNIPITFLYIEIVEII